MFASIIRRRQTSDSPKRRASRRLSPESLEDRKLMASINYIESSDTLELIGGSGADKAYITESSGNLIRVSFRGEVRFFDQDLTPQKIATIHFFGNAGNDAFDNQTSVRSVARGGSGNDVLRGGSTRDDLYGDSGDDILAGRDGNDFLYGGSGNDVLDGGNNNDMLEGGTGDDELTGGNHNDTYSFAGSDLGYDKIFGTAGVNTIDLRRRGGGNVLDLANTSEQTVRSGHLYLKLDSSAAIDHVWGSGYADTIRGNSLNNQLYGMGGNDTLIGRGGADLLNGGTGDDTFPEVVVTNHDLSATRGAGRTATWEQEVLNARDGYEIVDAQWNESSAVRGDSWLTSHKGSDATVTFWLDPDWDGSARVAGTLTLRQAPAGDRIVP
jgi:Ca2+-binding RTX toxin-like protein